MTKIVNLPFSSDFVGTSVSANGIHDFGANRPTGIANRLEIIDAAVRATVYQDDLLTNLGRRAEVQIGTFPTNSGDVWSSIDFKLDPAWSYPNLIMMGSWYPTPDSGDGTKHVTLGFRMIGTIMAVIVPASLPGETTSGETVARVEIVPGQWYNLCARINLQTTATGFREVYLNRFPILRQYGIVTTYTDAVGPYFKFGPYDGDHNNDFGSLRIFFRNAAMWTGNDGFQAVMGGVPVIPPRMLSI